MSPPVNIEKQIVGLLGEDKCNDSGVRVGRAEHLVEMQKLIFKRKAMYPDIVKPILESLIFSYDK